MTYLIGLEQTVEGRWIAWVLGHPGCFAYGDDRHEAFTAAEGAIQRYRKWIGAHTKQNWLPEGKIEMRLDEYCINEQLEDGYEINAWFRHDWKPLTEEDIARGLLLLEWSREELLAAVEGLSAEAMEAEHPGERWPIAGILRHVGGAEWWYLDRLGLAFPREQVPSDPFERLKVVRARLIEVLPTLAESKQVVGVDHEFWSPRKMLRRAVWHERDHAQHIARLAGRG